MKTVGDVGGVVATTTGANIRERVVMFLRDRDGIPVGVTELADGLGLTRQQVFNAMTDVVADMYPLVRKLKSSVWMFQSDRQAVSDVYELVTDLAGVRVVRGGDGKLYRLVEVDLT